MFSSCCRLWFARWFLMVMSSWGCCVLPLVPAALLEEVERMRVDGNFRRNSGQVSSRTRLSTSCFTTVLFESHPPYHYCSPCTPYVSSPQPAGARNSTRVRNRAVLVLRQTNICFSSLAHCFRHPRLTTISVSAQTSELVTSSHQHVLGTRVLRVVVFFRRSSRWKSFSLTGVALLRISP